MATASQPYRLDFSPADSLETLNNVLGRLFTDSDEMFHLLFGLTGASGISTVNLADGTIVTGVLLPVHGGTGLAAYTIGDLLYADGATSLAALADVATGNALISGGIGVAPSWGKIALTTHVSGTLPIANGGTNSATALSGSTLMVSDGSKIIQGAAGTTTTVLHGNAAGLPTYSAVDLAADVTGTLPIAKGGTNSATALSGSTLMVSDGSKIVQGSAGTTTTVLHGNAAGLPTYSAIDLTADVTGTLPIAKGGTNSATALSGSSIMVSDGSKVVQGTAGTTTTVLHGNASGLPVYGAVDLAADVTGRLPFANLVQGSALSVLGVTGNAGADHASIVAASDGQVLRRSGTAVAFGAVNLAGTNAVTGVLPVANFATGTPDGTKFVRDDGVLAVPTGSGATASDLSKALARVYLRG